MSKKEDLGDPLIILDKTKKKDDGKKPAKDKDEPEPLEEIPIPTDIRTMEDKIVQK